MSDRVIENLEQILEYSKRAAAYIEEAKTLECFLGDTKTQDAVMMMLLNIGELANHLPDEYIDAHPSIPWRAMVNFRNIAAHGYQIILMDRVWGIATESLPLLIDFLEQI